MEIKIESLCRDRTCSWVRIVIGMNKCVTETSAEILVASVGGRSTGQLVAKAGPRPTPTLTLSLVSVPKNERKWIDIEPGIFNQGRFGVSKLMIRLLRHDESVHRDEVGAVRFDDLASIFRSEFDGTSHWSMRAWKSFLAIGGGLNPNSSEHFFYVRSIQGHSGGTTLILHCETTCCYWTTSLSTCTTLGMLTTCSPSSSVD